MGGSVGVKRRKLIVRGLVPCYNIRLKGVIVAERWPSWAYTLSSLGWHTLFIFVKDLDLTTKRMFLQELNLSLDSYGNQLETRKLVGTNPVCWWVQGSKDFCSMVGMKLKRI